METELSLYYHPLDLIGKKRLFHAEAQVAARRLAPAQRE